MQMHPSKARTNAQNDNAAFDTLLQPEHRVHSIFGNYTY
jgi:hypothetical protein